VDLNCRVGCNTDAVMTFINPFLDYFTKVLEDNLKAVIKPQYVDQIPKAVKGPDRTVGGILKGRTQMDNYEEIIDAMGEQNIYLG